MHVCCSGFTELLHQYSPSPSSFKTPYSCKLYQQMGTDRSEGAGLDSQSKQALREVRAVCVPSDRRWKRRACRRVTSPSVEDGRRRRRSFDCFSQGRPASCLLRRGWTPSSPVWAGKPAGCFKKARKWVKMKIEMRWVGWGAFGGWRCSLQQADCSLANDP